MDLLNNAHMMEYASYITKLLTEHSIAITTGGGVITAFVKLTKNKWDDELWAKVVTFLQKKIFKRGVVDGS